METGLAERFTASAEEWTCACGRVNVAGLSLCPNCGRVPPRGVATIDVGPAGPSRPAWSPKVRGVRLAVGVIVLNFFLQVFMLALVEGGHMERSKANAKLRGNVMAWSPESRTRGRKIQT